MLLLSELTEKLVPVIAQVHFEPYTSEVYKVNMNNTLILNFEIVPKV